MHNKLNGEQKEEAKVIIDHYANWLKQGRKDFDRYDYEAEMKGVHKEFVQPQLAELYLKQFAEEAETNLYNNLFFKLYGHMQKYEDYFNK